MLIAVMFLNSIDPISTGQVTQGSRLVTRHALPSEISAQPRSFGISSRAMRGRYAFFLDHDTCPFEVLFLELRRATVCACVRDAGSISYRDKVTLSVFTLEAEIPLTDLEPWELSSRSCMHDDEADLRDRKESGDARAHAGTGN